MSNRKKGKKIKSIAAVIWSSLGFTACNSQDWSIQVDGVPKITPNTEGSGTTTDQFSIFNRVQTPRVVPADVRVLFVIDNSGSMQPIQTSLAQGMSNFANQYIKDGVKLRMGVIKTDTYLTNYYSSVLDTVPPQGVVGDAAFYSSLRTQFSSAVQVGINGSGDERGFDSLHRYMNLMEANTVNESAVEVFAPYTPPRDALDSPVFNVVTFISDEHGQANSDFGLGMGVFNHLATVIYKYTDIQMVNRAVQLASMMKTRADRYFSGIAGGAADPNYTMLSIVNATCDTSLGTRCGQNASGDRDQNERWGPEYTAVTDAVAADTANSERRYSKYYPIIQPNGVAADYSSLFDMIGSQLIDEVTFTPVGASTLSHTPKSVTQYSVHWSNGTIEAVQASDVHWDSAQVIELDHTLTDAWIQAGKTDGQLWISYDY